LLRWLITWLAGWFQTRFWQMVFGWAGWDGSDLGLLVGLRLGPLGGLWLGLLDGFQVCSLGGCWVGFLDGLSDGFLSGLSGMPEGSINGWLTGGLFR